MGVGVDSECGIVFLNPWDKESGMGFVMLGGSEVFAMRLAIVAGSYPKRVLKRPCFSAWCSSPKSKSYAKPWRKASLCVGAFTRFKSNGPPSSHAPITPGLYQVHDVAQRLPRAWRAGHHGGNVRP